MNKKGYIVLILGIIFIIIGVFLMDSDFSKYCVFLFPVGGIFVLLGFLSKISKNPEKNFENTINGIINTYDSILVKSSTVPSFDGRNIIEVMGFDDLIDAQLELRKPICYMKQTESCSFVLLDDKEAYVYIEKINDQVISPVEIEIKEMKIRNKNKEDLDAEMLRNIDKTTVVKLSNKKSYKVSPIRKKNNQEAIREDEFNEKSLNEDLEKDKEKKQDSEILDTTRKSSRRKSDDKNVELLDQTQRFSKKAIKNHKNEEIESLDSTRKLFKNEILGETDIEELSNTHKISKKELEKAMNEEIEYL